MRIDARTARLSLLLGILMTAQAASGLLWDTVYRDVPWIKATWFGNDWVTLVAAVPLLSAGAARARAGSTRGVLAWLGLLGYAVYNYAFYLLGAALNAFFLLYVLAFVLAVVLLVLALSRIDARRIADEFRPATPVRLIGGTLVCIGVGLACVWIGMWAAYVFAGRPTPVEPDAFRLVAALDLSLMVPALTAGGVLLWARRPWGFVIAAIASVQGAWYLLVLSVNSVVAVQRGFAAAPGELPVWGALAVVTGAAAVVLLANVRPTRGPDRP